MSRYLVLGNFTAQGLQNIKESPDRLAVAKQLAQDRGGRIVFFYLTMGQYDLAFLLEMPDDNSAARYMLELNQKGTITSTTLKAFTEDEYQSIVGSIS